MSEPTWAPADVDAAPSPPAKPTVRDQFEAMMPGWYDRVFDESPAAETSDIILAELVALFTEWMFAFKVSDASAKAVYLLLKTLLPENSNIGTWPQVKRALAGERHPHDAWRPLSAKTVRARSGGKGSV